MFRGGCAGATQLALAAQVPLHPCICDRPAKGLLGITQTLVSGGRLSLDGVVMLSVFIAFGSCGVRIAVGGKSSRTEVDRDTGTRLTSGTYQTRTHGPHAQVILVAIELWQLPDFTLKPVADRRARPDLRRSRAHCRIVPSENRSRPRETGAPPFVQLGSLAYETGRLIHLFRIELGRQEVLLDVGEIQIRLYWKKFEDEQAFRQCPAEFVEQAHGEFGHMLFTVVASGDHHTNVLLVGQTFVN